MTPPRPNLRRNEILSPGDAALGLGEEEEARETRKRGARRAEGLERKAANGSAAEQPHTTAVIASSPHLVTSLPPFFFSPKRRKLTWERWEMKQSSAAAHEALRVRRGLKRSSAP